MASIKPKDNDVSLPFAALQLLAPPVRLVSAALWKVLQQRDVMQYGVVEEFVTSACETVPGLLTGRHQAKLALGLRARLILELCSVEPDVNVIQPHLERIRVPAAPSASAVRKDVKIVRTVEHFHTLVHTLLTEPAEREQFYKDEFPAEYGPQFDRELEKLLWEFLIRLDQLLPVPNLAQTVSWLSDAPPVLEECAQAATQPQLLEIILQHQTCLGHLEAAASLPPNMGDSILASMSLPPSGRVREPSANQSKAPITPVFGLISNEDTPIMRTLKSDLKESKSFTSIKHKPEDDGGNAGSSRSTRMKRKHPEEREESSSEGEEDSVGPSKRKSRREEERGARAADNESRKKTIPATSAINPPRHDSLSSVVASCLSNQPRVVVERLSVQAVCTRSSGKDEATPSSSERRSALLVKSPRRKRRSCHPTSEPEFPGLDDKENLPLSSSVSSLAPQRRVTADVLAGSGEGDDYVADSEDEATKNFKGRLFTKRYYKTKHGTYVPTLREFWKPGVARCSFLSAGSKHR